MTGTLRTVAETAAAIERGEVLIVAGDAHLLRQLPAGNWIGGSIPYLPGEGDPESGLGLVHVTTLGAGITEVAMRVYDATSVREVYSDLADKGFGVVIIPASSPTHLEFALHAPEYAGFAVRPLVGWISGVRLDGPEDERPSAHCGTTGEVVEDGAVVLQVTLPPGLVAEVGVVNMFEQGDGEAITFPENGFDVATAFVDGVGTNFADFVHDKGLDTRLPLVADYYGLMVNVSFQAVDRVGHLVRFYSPVFAGLTYRHARPIGDYARDFVAHLPGSWPQQVVFSCNCILNYFYSELAGKQGQAVSGPLTFGEVAYQLLNQTMVYLTVSQVATDGRVRGHEDGRSASAEAGHSGNTGTDQA
jgi:hypothetical protein